MGCLRCLIVMLGWLTTLSLLIPLPAAAWTVVWDMPTGYPEGNLHTENIRQFATDVWDLSRGGLDIRVHTNGNLIEHPEIAAAVESGRMAIGETLMSSLTQISPLFAVDSVPFLAVDYPSARKLDQVSRRVLEPLLATQGLRLLFTVPWPPQGLYTRQDIVALGDLSGKRIRTYNAVTERFAILAGAVPTAVEAAAIPQAFATGQIEAMLTSAATGIDSAAWNHVRVFYDLRAWLPRNMVIVNERNFQTLDAATRAALLQAAAQAEQRGWQSSEVQHARHLQRLTRQGIRVQRPTGTLADDLAMLGAVLVAEWIHATGPAGMMIITDLVR